MNDVTFPKTICFQIALVVLNVEPPSNLIDLMACGSKLCGITARSFPFLEHYNSINVGQENIVSFSPAPLNC